MKLDIKALIPILSIVALLGGFYYTTQLRLDTLEEKVSTLSKSEQDLSKRVGALEKRVNRLSKKNKKAN